MKHIQHPLVASVLAFASPRLTGQHPISGVQLRVHALACASLAMRDHADEELAAAALLVHIVAGPEVLEEAARLAPRSAELASALPALRASALALENGRTFRLAESAVPAGVQQLLLLEARILARELVRGLRKGRGFWVSLPRCPWVTMVEIRQVLNGFLGDIPWTLMEEVQRQVWEVEKALRRFGVDLLQGAVQARGGPEALVRSLGEGASGRLALALKDDLWAFVLAGSSGSFPPDLPVAEAPAAGSVDGPLILPPVAEEDPWLPVRLDILCAQWEILRGLLKGEPAW